jgi:taurine dioxygenase
MTPTIGAEVLDIDLSRDLHEKAIQGLEDALTEWKVLFFRDQDMTREQHVAFARHFGDLEIHPFTGHREGSPELMVLSHGDEPRVEGAYAENIWHSGVSWREVPSKASVLRAIEVPEVGGDTLWSDMYAAYEGLSRETRSFIDDLTAIHDFMPAFGPFISPEKSLEMRAAFPPVHHPVVRTHPVTGRPLLYVNSSFTTRITGMSLNQSNAILHLLFEQVAMPEYQCRFHWRQNSIAMWDNRCTQHYATQNYWPQRRVMERATIIGDRPTGPVKLGSAQR